MSNESVAFPLLPDLILALLTIISNPLKWQKWALETVEVEYSDKVQKKNKNTLCVTRKEGKCSMEDQNISLCAQYVCLFNAAWLFV